MVDNDQPQADDTHISFQVSPEMEIGIYADFANVWRTQNTFIIDFATVSQPTHDGPGPDGRPTHIIPARVSRIRIAPEQIFPLIDALKEAGDDWLAETGRQNPPDSFWHDLEINS